MKGGNWPWQGQKARAAFYNFRTEKKNVMFQWFSLSWAFVAGNNICMASLSSLYICSNHAQGRGILACDKFAKRGSSKSHRPRPCVSAVPAQVLLQLPLPLTTGFLPTWVAVVLPFATVVLAQSQLHRSTIKAAARATLRKIDRHNANKIMSPVKLILLF